MPTSPLRRVFAIHAALIATLAALSFGVLLYSGALQSGLSANPDEAAHYVTALMIHAYLVEGFATTPLQFAENYYLHYPKVAFGIWPPMFHVALAIWMFVTVASPASALVFIAITLVVLAYVMFRAALPHLGLPLAAMAAAWLLLLPTTQRTAASVLLDVPNMLLMASAAIVFGRYLDSQRWRDALLFALLSSVALLTKNNALALALLPPIAIAVSRKWFIFKRWSLWTVPLIVAAVCVPWYWLTWHLFTFVAAMAGDAWTAPRDNFLLLIREPGLIFVPLALMGVWTRVGRDANNGLWNSLFALIASVWIFHSFVYPISAPRYMLPAYAGLVFFCAAGIDWLAMRFEPRKFMARELFAGLVLVLFLFSGFHVQPKPRRGFIEAADVMLTAGLRENGTVLVCSDPIGEGSFIASVATKEHGPQTIVLRASKLLAHSSWVGEDYVARYRDEESLMRAVNRARVEFIAMDGVNESPHHELLVRSLSASSDWSIVREVVPAPPTPDRSTVRLYGRMTPLPPGPPTFKIDLKESLGYSLQR